MFTTFGFLTPETTVILLVVALVIFGPGKLPELGKSLGKSLNEFKAATNGEPDRKEKKEASEPVALTKEKEQAEQKA